MASDEQFNLGSLGRIGLIGAGAVGSALALALAARGAQIVAVTARHEVSAEALAARIPGCAAVGSPAAVAAASDLVFVATPDDAIAQLAAEQIWATGQAVVHLSGAVGAERLAAAARQGARIGSLHPLAPFPAGLRDTSADDLLARLAGVTWATEAPDPALAAILRRIVAALGGRAITLTAAGRAPYHLSAVLASNYVVTLLGAAVTLWGEFGVAPDQALAALLPLLRATVENLATVGLPDALTGPLARGDISTVATHLAWLREHVARPTAAVSTPTSVEIPDAGSASSTVRAAGATTPTLVDLDVAYRALARLTIPLALAKGTLSDEQAQQLRALLSAPAEAPTQAAATDEEPLG